MAAPLATGTAKNQETTDVQRNDTKSTAAPATAVRIGRLVESNLTNWATATMSEMARADRAGGDTGDLLTIGLALLRARHAVRAGIHDVELQAWEARR